MSDSVRSFRVGELVKRKHTSVSSKGFCVVVENDGDNYVLYNNSLRCLQRVMCTVVENMYIKHT